MWDGLSFRRSMANLIPLTVFWVIWKERNARTFEEKECNLNRLKDRWIHYFGFILLCHDIVRDVDFVNVINTITHL